MLAGRVDIHRAHDIIRASKSASEQSEHMRLISFLYGDTIPRVGVQISDILIDLSAGAPLVFESLIDVHWQLLDILGGEPDGMGLDGAAEIAAAVLDQLDIGDADDQDALESAAMQARGGPISIGGAEMVLPLQSVHLLAPLPRPSSLRDFYAFEQHVASAARIRGRSVPLVWYEIPTFYFGNHQAIYAPDEAILLPRTAALDYELEIACVIGRAGRDIPEEDAEDYIAGYMIMNDWSARDLQLQEMAIGLGPAKGKDFATSLGPALVTPDELAAQALSDGRYNLTMVARVNGVERSRGNFRDIYYTFAQMI